ncbi:MAG: redoxin domain-containing protein [Chloroflexi bacterium]|nr:redoxin domain-containing protein [Chloroflexota bacterium]
MRNLTGILLGLVGALGVILLPQQFQKPATTITTAAPTAEQTLTVEATAEPTTEVVSKPAPYPNLGVAPEFRDDVWLNTESSTPLRLTDLHGQVVLLEFWTFECINCLHILPHVLDWYDTYHDQGLNVVGIHFPEFSYEADYNNLVAAVKRLEIPFPVGQDNDGATWNAYGQRYWPTVYLIDKQGNIRYVHIGEGGYNETEIAIQGLLAENT